ncbi:class I SAM-dependent methyltransferase [Endozoicomonas sp. 2B-B]
MELDKVVPWGRTLEEYESMFCLSEEDKRKKILGCGDGPASFNAELTLLGGDITSIDPIYKFSKSQISNRIDEVRPQIMEQMHKNQSNYIWLSIQSSKKLESVRMSAMKNFLSDYDTGKSSNRYIDASLPDLPFSDKEFDLALCSHFLFLYSEHFTESQHLESIMELCRVSKEVRVYPLVSLDNRQSKHLPAVTRSLENNGINVTIKPARCVRIVVPLTD